MERHPLPFAVAVAKTITGTNWNGWTSFGRAARQRGATASAHGCGRGRGEQPVLPLAVQGGDL